MKKHNLVMLFIIYVICIFAVGCTRSDEYNNVMKEKIKLTNELNSMKDMRDNLENNNFKLKSELDEKILQISKILIEQQQVKEINNELEEKVSVLTNENKELLKENEALNFYKNLRDFNELEESYKLWLIYDQYKNKNLLVYDVEAERVEIGTDLFAGINFKIRNNGKQDLNKINIKIYFLDKQATPIYESDYKPLKDTNQTTENLDGILKSGYIWESGKEFILINELIPSEWDSNEIEIEIEEIGFEN